jgi:hypothetical protein
MNKEHEGKIRNLVVAPEEYAVGALVVVCGLETSFILFSARAAKRPRLMDAKTILRFREIDLVRQAAPEKNPNIFWVW